MRYEAITKAKYEAIQVHVSVGCDVTNPSSASLFGATIVNDHFCASPVLSLRSHVILVISHLIVIQVEYYTWVYVFS